MYFFHCRASGSSVEVEPVWMRFFFSISYSSSVYMQYGFTRLVAESKRLFLLLKSF
jgi:hypothetical protein